MSHKEYVGYFSTRDEAYQAMLGRLKIWKRVRGTRTMGIEFYKGKWWIVIHH